jgi:CRP-like cAMP-binding protein/HEAT repeat protein
VALVQLIGVDNLLWLVALTLLICSACVIALGHWQQAALVTAAHIAPPSSRHVVSDLRTIINSPLLRAIGGLTILLALLINIGAYQFYQSLQRLFAGHEADMAAYLGAFEFWAGMAAVVVQLFLTGRLMNRFGIFMALLLFPLAMALGAGLSIVLGGVLWTITLIRAADPTFQSTINTAALNVLYLPFSANIRERAKELFEAMYAASFGLAGLVFLIMQQVPGWDDQYYAIPLLILAASWLVLLGWTRRQYTLALADSLKRRVLDLEHVTIDVTDETTVHLLVNALHDSDELHVLHTLQLIAEAASVNWDAHVVPLLTHASATINLQAIRYIGRPGNIAYLPAITPFLDTANNDVRAAAIAAYCTMAGSAASLRITPFLADADPQVKGAAVAGLILHSDGDDAQRAVAELQHMLESHDSTARLEGTRIIGMVQSSALAARLIPHFADINRDVRTSAIQAAGALNTPALVPYLVRALEDKASASAAGQALGKYTHAIEAQLSTALDSPLIGSLIPRILEQLGTQPAIAVLLAHFHTPDDDIRAEVYYALARLRANGVAFDLPAAVLRAALFGEIRRCYAWVVLREDVVVEGADQLLSEAIQIRLRRTFDRIFFLLSLLSPKHTQQVRRVRQALDAQSDALRALAIEQLDNITEHRVKEFLLPLIEAPAEQLIGIAQKQFTIERCTFAERLRSLALGGDRWLRICALVRIGTLRQIELLDAVQTLLTAEEALLRETALVACGRLVKAELFTALVTAHASDERCPIVQRYAQAQLRLFAAGTDDRVPTALLQPPQGVLMPLSTIERVLLLKGVELFHHIASEELVPLALIAQEMSFPLGATLIRQGEPGDCLYIIVAGEASINIRGVGTVARRTARDCLGEMGLLSRQPRSADCVALTDITALRIERADFWEVLAEMPALALGVIDTLSQRLDEAVANLQNAHLKESSE